MSKLLLRCIKKDSVDALDYLDNDITIGRLYLGESYVNPLSKNSAYYYIINDQGLPIHKYTYKFEIVSNTAAKLLYGVCNE